MRRRSASRSANAARGRAAQAQGAALERYLLESAAASGLLLAHVPTPVQILRRQDPDRDPRLVLGRLETPRWVDFTGVLPGGRAVLLEAKTSTSERWRLGDRLRGHQGELLASAAGVGAVAAVYVRHAVLGGGEYLIPWGADGSPLGERASVGWPGLARWRVPAGVLWTRALVQWEAYLDGGWGEVEP